MLPQEYNRFNWWLVRIEEMDGRVEDEWLAECNSEGEESCSI